MQACGGACKEKEGREKLPSSRGEDFGEDALTGP